jgi:predicted acylesterase/phospholipase RssA/CRP-like cAMP-binding protein
VTVDRAARPPRAAGALSASPYFRGLAEPWLRLLGQAASRRRVAAGEVLETEVGPAGTPCLYLLVTGEVSASTPADPEGISEVIGHEGAGSVFGSRLITGEEDVPVYRAVVPVQVEMWELPELERLFAESDELRREVETRLSVRRRRSELVDLLRRTPLFRQASQSLIRWLVASTTLGWFEPGSMICRQGDEGDAMFLIVSGEVVIVQDEAAEPLQQLHRGDFFGEIALMQHSIRIASAIAVSNAEVLIVGKDAFDVLYRRSPSFRHAVRATAEMRLESNVSGRPDPELVWLVNDTACPSEQLAALVVEALREVGGAVVDPRPLQGRNAVGALLETGREEGAGYVVCFSGATVEGRLGRHVADQAGGVVYFTGNAAAPFPYRGTSLHRVHHVVVSTSGAASQPQPVRRDAFALALPSELQVATIEDLPLEAQAALRRIARAVGHQRVGVALGGGAAWGYAHVALLRALERAQIPVDLLVGVSVGSIVGAFYSSRGLDGLDRLVSAKLELSAAAIAAIGTTSSVGLFLRRHIPETRLEELPLPLATVAVEAETGREVVFRHGSLATAVRASCSLPGVFGRPVLGGQRYLDACVRHNVPASYCAEAGADFVIACDVVPPPRASRVMGSGLRALALELLQVNRLTDTVRSLYWLASDSGRQQADLADALFAPDLAEFNPWDFHRADAIVEHAEEQLDDWLPAARARYQALARPSRADG